MVGASASCVAPGQRHRRERVSYAGEVCLVLLLFQPGKSPGSCSALVSLQRNQHAEA